MTSATEIDHQWSPSGTCEREPACQLLQLRVLGFSFFQDGDIGDVFSEGEEIFVRRERADAVGVDIRPLQLRRLQGIGASHSQMSRCSRPALPYDAAVVENLLKLDDGGAALTRCQIRPAAYTHLVEAGHIGNERNLP